MLSWLNNIADIKGFKLDSLVKGMSLLQTLDSYTLYVVGFKIKMSSRCCWLSLKKEREVLSKWTKLSNVLEDWNDCF